MKSFLVLLGIAALAIAPLATRAQAPAPDAPATQAQVDKVQSDVDTLKSQVNEPESAIQTTIADVAKLKKITFSGYAQLRLEDNRGATVNNAATGSGDARFTFSQRRVRLKVVGRPTDSTQVTYSFDLGDKGFVTKDAFIDYFVKGDPAYGFTGTMGQFALPFGYQNTQSSSTMEAPERARVVKALFPDEYDRGIKVSTPTDRRVYGDLAIVNGTGQNATDTTQNKNLVGRVRMKVTPGLDAGLSAYLGGKDFIPATATLKPDGTISTTAAVVYPKKNRFGADFQCYLNGASIKGEYITAKDQNVTKTGFYLLASHNITAVDALVVMFDSFKDPLAKNPAKALVGTQTAWTVGINHYLDTATRLRLFYEINAEEHHAYSNNALRFEVLSVF